MRLHFTLSPNTEPVPFAYQHKLTGVFHNWLKRNELHDKISLYSLAWLDGSRRVRDRLQFANGAKWFVSFFEDEHAEKLVHGALTDPEMFCGMRVTRIEQQTTPDFGTKIHIQSRQSRFHQRQTATKRQTAASFLIQRTRSRRADERNT